MIEKAKEAILAADTNTALELLESLQEMLMAPCLHMEGFWSLHFGIRNVILLFQITNQVGSLVGGHSSRLS